MLLHPDVMPKGDSCRFGTLSHLSEDDKAELQRIVEEERKIARVEGTKLALNRMAIPAKAAVWGSYTGLVTAYFQWSFWHIAGFDDPGFLAAEIRSVLAVGLTIVFGGLTLARGLNYWLDQNFTKKGDW